MPSWSHSFVYSSSVDGKGRLRKPNGQYYREFRALFEAHEPSLLPEFDGKVNSRPPLEVFTWLDSLRVTHEQLGKALNPLLTDFFYSNH